MIGKKLTKKQRADLIAFEGSHVDAAIACGVNVTMASKIRKNAGVKVRVWGAYSDETTARILELHAKGWSHSAIGREVGRSTQSITGKLGSIGATTPKKPARVSPAIAQAIANSNAYFAKLDKQSAAK